MNPPDHVLARLVLAHQGDVDRWAAAVAAQTGRGAAFARALARRVAVEGDTLGARVGALIAFQ